MRTIQAKPLTADAFRQYGTFWSAVDGEGYGLGGGFFTFYPDRIAVSSEKRIGFSTLKVSKPEKYIVEELEYHKTTWEMFMPLNDDAVLHAAPKSGGDVVTELTEAFIVPKGTMVKLDAAVWHLAAMPVNVEELQSLIVLPEGTYMNDCTKVALNDEQKFEKWRIEGGAAVIQMTGTKIDTIKIRQLNREQTFEYIKKNPMATRADVAKELNLSFPTVTSIVTELEEAGLIRAEKSTTNTGGRSSMAYSCDENARCAIGIQLSERYMKGLVLNLQGNVIGNVITEKLKFRSDDNYRRKIGELYQRLVREMGLKEGEILGVGITVEGLTDNEGERVTCSFTEQMSDVRREELAKYIPVETRLFHDMTAAGYNQKLKLGQNVFYLSLNSSIGGTVLVQDEVYNGNHNRAGEIGHMRLEKNGRRCYCGNYGCFDAYCNTLILKDAAGGELKDFFAGIDQGNREYERILDEYVERLSDAVFNIRMLYDDTVLIGGELGEYADYFIEKVWRILDSQDIYREESAKDYVKVCEDGENVIAIGAAMYYINQAAVRL